MNYELVFWHLGLGIAGHTGPALGPVHGADDLNYTGGGQIPGPWAEAAKALKTAKENHKFKVCTNLEQKLCIVAKFV